MPAEDTTIQFLATYSLQDNRVRLTLDGTMWTGSKFAKCREVIIYTPNGARHLREIDGELKVGHVEKSPDYFMANTEAFLPLTHFFRSGSDYPSRTLVAHKLKEVGKQVRIGDQECRAFAKASESANTQLYYLISSKEWIVARRTIKDVWPGSRIVYDINYRSDTSGLDIPNSWEVKTVFAKSCN